MIRVYRIHDKDGAIKFAVVGDGKRPDRFIEINPPLTASRPEDIVASLHWLADQIERSAKGLS